MRAFSKKRSVLFSCLLILWAFFFTSCGDDSRAENADADTNTTKTVAQDNKKDANGLTPFEAENGFGPMKKKLALAAIDPELSKKGLEIFETKCLACHKMDERYVGPPLRGVTKRRTPEYILNFIMNPEENLQKHPEAKKLLGEYFTPMPNQSLSEDDAKALLDYFRQMVSEKQ